MELKAKSGKAFESADVIKTGSPPDFKNEGVAVWINTTKDGEQYLTVQLFGKNGIKINVFKYQPKQV
jgi:hypothetical protein